ncbi:MAG TPA: pyruvate kinase, partial [Acidimicrobiales bacterium]|nr:pyruvate kinase [Acidimicrobiales bacterium]
DEGVALEIGARVTLAPAEPGDSSDARRIAVDHAELLHDIRAGDQIALGDGGVSLVVENVGTDTAQATVRSGGRVGGRPGVNLPPERFSIATPTADDLRIVDALCETGVDAIAVSFVRDHQDVRTVKAAVGPDGPMVVAKIETQSAVDDLEAVVASSDGVMVARGDLGARCALEDVPHYQKRIIRVGVAFGRPVITATQMLESMISAPTPTRAEVSDVANAVFDGTSAVMLSAETAVGRDPVNVIATMSRILVRAEQEFDYRGWGAQLGRLQTASSQSVSPRARITAAISAAAWRAATEVDVAAIIACTNNGATARAISRFRPTVPILAATPSVETARQLSVAWGIKPMLVDPYGTTDEIVWFAVESATKRGFVKRDDIVAVLVGSPTEPDATTDVLRLVRVH